MLGLCEYDLKLCGKFLITIVTLHSRGELPSFLGGKAAKRLKVSFLQVNLIEATFKDFGGASYIFYKPSSTGHY